MRLRGNPVFDFVRGSPPNIDLLTLYEQRPLQVAIIWTSDVGAVDPPDVLLTDQPADHFADLILADSVSADYHDSDVLLPLLGMSERPRQHAFNSCAHSLVWDDVREQAAGSVPPRRVAFHSFSDREPLEEIQTPLRGSSGIKYEPIVGAFVGIFQPPFCDGTRLTIYISVLEMRRRDVDKGIWRERLTVFQVIDEP